jgi:hypothetical protein
VQAPAATIVGVSSIRTRPEQAFKRSDRVHLKVNDETRGTVSLALPDGRFSVTFDGTRDVQGRRRRGGKYDYPWHAAEGFVVIT